MGLPFHWVMNGNGSRVLSYLTGIRSGPHYEIPSTELATWLELQGKNRWWNVDSDALLTGRLSFPCPADELAKELRKISRPLLVRAIQEDALAQGQNIGAEKLDELVARIGTNVPNWPNGTAPASSGDRLLCLCWKDRPSDWILVEDSETTAQVDAEQVANA